MSGSASDGDGAPRGAGAEVRHEPGSKYISWLDYDPTAVIRCARCDWSGEGGPHEQLFEQLLDVTCPRCDSMLLVVTFATLEETRAAALEGNDRAIAYLPEIEARRARYDRAEATLLTGENQLPELSGDRVEIEWDLVGADTDGAWQVLRHHGVEIWREMAFYESYERFEAVAEILRARYGDRLRALTPTHESCIWLYGDQIGSVARVDGVNRRLAEANSATYPTEAAGGHGQS